MSHASTQMNPSNPPLGAHRLALMAVLAVGAGCEGAHPDFEITQHTSIGKYRAEQQQMLTSYSAVDDANGVYRIPVDRALELVANDESLLGPVVEVKSDLEEMTLAERGEYHFKQTYACSACHALDGSKMVGPALNGRWGKKAPLQGGDVVTFDDEYFRESVYYSTKKVARGYQPVMPVFANQMTDEHFEAIKAYIKEYQ